MVNVGIIGLGNHWESRYRPALTNLRKRIRVNAVYDAVTNRARQIAKELSATAVEGVIALSERADVDALIFLDESWHSFQAVELLSRGNKPVLVAGGLHCNLQKLQDLDESARAHGLTLMPEFGRRYTPATGRLQELMATRIGRPQHITINAVSPKPNGSTSSLNAKDEFGLIVSLLDWCRYIVRTPPVSLRTNRLDSNHSNDSPGRTITVEFSPSRSGSGSSIAELRIHAGETPDSVTPGSPQKKQSGELLSHEVVCETGKAVLHRSTEISWCTDSQPIVESLLSERSEFEVMLDHFCRRVVGGLVPIAEISDVCRSVHLANAAEESLKTGEKISLNGKLA